MTIDGRTTTAQCNQGKTLSVRCPACCQAWALARGGSVVRRLRVLSWPVMLAIPRRTGNRSEPTAYLKRFYVKIATRSYRTNPLRNAVLIVLTSPYRTVRVKYMYGLYCREQWSRTVLRTRRSTRTVRHTDNTAVRYGTTVLPVRLPTV